MNRWQGQVLLCFCIALLSIVAHGDEQAPATPRNPLPNGGYRYWSTPFRPTPLWGCYVSVTPRDGGVEFWNAHFAGAGPTGFCMAVWRGPDLDRLGKPTAVFNAAQVNDVVHRQHPDQKWTDPRFDRSHVQYIPGTGYVGLLCVNPEYKPGSVDLIPALMLSPQGQAGDGMYLGKLAGDPADEAAKRMLWSDGGTILQLATGRWRIYLNGYGTTLAALGAEKLDGPWRFLRNESGAIRELCPDYESSTTRPGSCFPNILRVSDTEWHLWLSDQWEPQHIWHFWSTDGLAWKPYGTQPEISRAAVGGKPIKCLRTYLDPATGRIAGLLSVWEKRAGGEEAWHLYRSEMPSGPPPALSVPK